MHKVGIDIRKQQTIRIWDGTSVYTKKTQEQNADGSYETITADFRKYPCVEDSVADHSAYLLGAKNGRSLRYKGIKGMTDYKKVAQLIKDGGYATSLTLLIPLRRMQRVLAELQMFLKSIISHLSLHHQRGGRDLGIQVGFSHIFMFMIKVTLLWSSFFVTFVAK